MWISAAAAAQNQGQTELDSPTEEVTDSARSMLEGFLDILPRIGVAQGQQGTVEAITIRETRMKTFDGRLVIIPNRDVYKSVIVVQTHYEVRRLNFVVGVAYENDAAEARQVVMDALASVEGIRSDPAPEALINQLNVSTVDIDARFWTDPPQHDARIVLDRAIRAVKAALDTRGIEMPADIIALQATSSFKAALQNDAEVTPAGSVVAG